MDFQEKLRLQKIYEEEMAEEELIEMALADKEDYSEKEVYDLVMSAIRHRGLEEKIKSLKKGHAEEYRGKDKRWIDIFKFNNPDDGVYVKTLLKEKSIPIDFIYREFSYLSTQEGTIKVPLEHLEIAKQVIADFDKIKKPAPYQESNEIITESIITVLNRRKINEPEKIAEEVLQEIEKVEE